MSSKFNLNIIDKIAEKNLNMKEDIENKELALDDIQNIEQATFFIKQHDSQITNSWFQLSHALKKVKDEKLYKDSYENFKEYFENELKYNERMVYNFIKIADTFPIETKQSLIQLGVTKLISLSNLDTETRESFVAENDLSKMSAREITKKIKNPTVINPSNYNATFSLRPDEHVAVKTLYGNINGFQHVVEDLAMRDTKDMYVSHQQFTYLQDILKKTKKEMERVEKIIKKYL